MPASNTNRTANAHFPQIEPLPRADLDPTAGAGVAPEVHARAEPLVKEACARQRRNRNYDEHYQFHVCVRKSTRRDRTHSTISGERRIWLWQSSRRAQGIPTSAWNSLFVLRSM